jgi:alpha-amylase
MFTAGGGPGEVHSYFSPFESPMDAFVAAQTLLNDFEARLRLSILAANDPFLFYTGVGKEYYTGAMAWSLKGFTKTAAEVDIKALAFHVDNGDFESWAEHSLRDQKLATYFRKLKLERARDKGEALRKAIVDFATKRFATLSNQVQDATQLF